MMTKRFQFTVDHMIGRREVEVLVTYSCTPFVEATHWQPAEGGEVEIVSAKVNGMPITLSEEEEEALLEQACERASQDWADDAAAEADWRYQEYRDRLLMDQWERSA